MRPIHTAALFAICLTPFLMAQEFPTPPTVKEISEARSSMNVVKARQEYRRLLPLWQEERKKYESSSNTYDYWEGPHGKAIIALGPAILPDIMQEIRKGDFWFNVPMNLITKLSVAEGVSEQERSAAWIAWWDQSTPVPKPAAARPAS